MMMKKCLFLLLTTVCLIVPGYAQQGSTSITDDLEAEAASLEDDLLPDGITISGTPSLSARSGASEPLFKPVGYGKAATGGRGGRVIKVTSLADNEEPGTFRSACLAKGSRIVIFEVSGVITLLSPLTITEGNITIAGQTAPGDGITLVNGPDNDRPSLKIKAENVIVQYLKIRTGDAMEQNPKESDNQVDAITVTNGGKRVIIDHLSLSWAIDETIQLWSAQDVTVQKCIISESLTYK